MKKQPSFAALMEMSPVRALDWRWQRAWNLFHAGQYYTSRRDDVATARALQYIRAQFGTTTPWYKRKLLRGLADIEAALAIHGGLPQARLEVEARILARQSAREIARRTGISAEAVVSYEALFYCVADRLDATTFIATQVIGPTTLNSAGAPHYPALLKLLAYQGGPPALEAMLRFFAHKSAGTSAATLATGDRLVFDSIELFIKADTLTLDPAVAEDLVKKWPVVQQILRKAPRDHTLSAEFAKQTVHILGNLVAEACRPPQIVRTDQHVDDPIWVAA